MTATAENAYAIEAANGALIIEGGEVNAIANTTGSGLYADGAVDISGATTVKALGNLYGINSGTSITINGGDVTATGTTSQGIYTTGAINIVKSDEAGSLKVTATGGYGIYSDGGNVTVEDAEVIAEGSSDDAIKAETVSLTNANVTAMGADGIYAVNGALTISGGDVTATGESGYGLFGESGYGLFADNGLTINGGTVKATGTGDNAAIYASSGDITLTNATVTATAENANAIEAANGALTIDGGKVTATATGENGYGLYASGNINISWTDEENDFIDASSYNGTIVVADGQHFRAVSGENTMAFISGTLDKNDADDLDLINSLAGTTLVPFETNGYVVTTVDADLTAGDEPNFTNGDTKFYVYEKDATVTVAYTGEGIVQVTGMDADKFSDAHTFAMPEEDVILTYKGEVLVDNNFTLANSSVDYNAEPQAPGIKYDDVDFAEAYYTLSYTKEGKSTPPSQVQNPGNYVVTLTGKGAYIGEVDINEVFVIMPSSAYATTLFAAGSTNQWMTWCGTEELVTPENVEVYTISGIDNSSVALEDITGSATFGNQEMNVIPAYTPVLIWRNSEEELTEAICAAYSQDGTVAEAVQKEESFWFIGNPADEATETSGLTDAKHYILYDNEFVLVDTDEGIPAHRCVLKLITQTQNTAPRLSIVIDGETTSLASMEDVRCKMEDVWYTLDGRKLQGKPTKKGLYIHNGRKVVIK